MKLCLSLTILLWRDVVLISLFSFVFSAEFVTCSLPAVLVNPFSLQTCLITILMHDPLAQKLRDHLERSPMVGRIPGRNGNVVEMAVKNI